MSRRISYRHSSPVEMHIKGKTVSRSVALITYRCAECQALLKERNAGLICSENPNHKGFIHRNEAKRIIAEQAAQLAEVEAGYEIVDGQIRPKKEVTYATE